MNNDITKCPGGECPVKEQCVRFLAEGNGVRQSYFTEIPGREDEGLWDCEWFWETPGK